MAGSVDNDNASHLSRLTTDVFPNPEGLSLVPNSECEKEGKEEDWKKPMCVFIGLSVNFYDSPQSALTAQCSLLRLHPYAELSFTVHPASPTVSSSLRPHHHPNVQWSLTLMSAEGQAAGLSISLGAGSHP